MEVLVIKPKNKEQLEVFESLAKAFKMPLAKKRAETPYNAKFEIKMKRAEEDKKAKKFKAIKTEDLWK
ncbi:MAG TPA: DUF2683 family protein [Puia sp.]|jgi:hypothetical protein|nr:DUF2683 family protein [Puia sp.]